MLCCNIFYFFNPGSKMNAALLNGNEHETIYLSMQLSSKVSILVVILNVSVCATWKPIGLCVLHYTIVKSHWERTADITKGIPKGDNETAHKDKLKELKVVFKLPLYLSWVRGGGRKDLLFADGRMIHQLMGS